MPEPMSAEMLLKLDGSDVEGRMIIPEAPEEVKIVGTFDGKHLSGHIEIDTGGMGYPQIEVDLVEEDHLVGKVSFQGLEIDLDAVRIDKGSVEFKVVRRRTRGKDGRPLPPKVEEGLEPLRSVLEGDIPIVVRVQTPAQIASVLEIQEAFEIHVVLLDAEGARAHVVDLAALKIGVIVPRRVIQSVNHTRYHQSDDLARRDVPIAFQSSAEDGARTLRQWGLYAVERGLSADAALSALTVGAARMFNLDDRIGSLNVGLDADLVIFDGHPFEAGSRVRRVIVGGEEVR